MRTVQAGPGSSHHPKLTIAALPGNGGGAFRFERVLPHLSAGVAFKALTLPGFAGLPPNPALQSMGDYAGEVHRLIAAEPPPLVLLGHGLGGSIALEFAQHFPAAVDALILHAPAGPRLESPFFPRLMARLWTRRLGRWLFSARLARLFFKRRLFSGRVPPDYVSRFFAAYRRCAVFEQMFELITPDWFASLRPVDLPAALLWGKQERLLALDPVAEFRALLPNCIVRLVPGWGHFPMIERPREYAREIIRLSWQLLRR